MHVVAILEMAAHTHYPDIYYFTLIFDVDFFFNSMRLQFDLPCILLQWLPNVISVVSISDSSCRISAQFSVNSTQQPCRTSRRVFRHGQRDRGPQRAAEDLCWWFQMRTTRSWTNAGRERKIGKWIEGSEGKDCSVRESGSWTWYRLLLCLWLSQSYNNIAFFLSV